MTTYSRCIFPPVYANENLTEWLQCLICGELWTWKEAMEEPLRPPCGHTQHDLPNAAELDKKLLEKVMEPPQ